MASHRSEIHNRHQGHHLDDVGIQYRVVSGFGLDVASACLAHVNRNYVYTGGDIDPRQFFRIRNLTRRVGLSQPKITFRLRSEFTVLGMPQAAGDRSGAALHRSRYMRILRALQSAAPAGSHRIPTAPPRQRGRGA